MHTPRIVLTLILLLLTLRLVAQDGANTLEPPKPQKYVAVIEEAPRLPFFQGFTVSFDLFGVGQYLLSDYGTLEGALRLNLKNTFFPIVEAGYAICDSEDGNTSIRYKTQAPYLRAGIDINMLRNKFQDNRLYLGARYGISRYNFDIISPPLTDPIWGEAEASNVTDIATTSHWFEIVAGVEVQLWRNIHMGWSIRYKKDIHSTHNRYASPYYIPGYGTTTHSSAWGFTYNLIFDLNWGKSKKGKTHTVTLIDHPVDNETTPDGETSPTPTTSRPTPTTSPDPS